MNSISKSNINSHSPYLDILEYVDQGIVEVDADLRLVAWNRRYQMILGYPEDFLHVGKPGAELLRFLAERGDYGPGDIDALVEHRLQLIQSKTLPGHDLVMADGRAYDVRVHGSSKGGLVITFSDITERKKMEEDLRRGRNELESRIVERTHALQAQQKELQDKNDALQHSKDELEAKSHEINSLIEATRALNERLKSEIRSKDRFFSIVAHDLKNPLNSVLGLTQLMAGLSDKFEKNKFIEYAELIHRSGQDLFELLENLLDWSRIQTGSFSANRSGVRTSEMLTRAFKATHFAAREKDIEMAIEPVDIMVFVDRNMIETVCRNLLSNAVKFTPRGGRIKIAYETNSTHVTLSVQDNGVGIHPFDQINLFLVDEKTSTQGTDGETGTGLGLPLCQEMMRQNGGEIWVESAIGEGATFYISLPLFHETPTST